MRRDKVLQGLLIIAVLLLLRSPAATAERRTALVIGNAAYEVGPLRNPGNDAHDMAATLQRLGFEVTLRRDVDRRTIQEAIDAFSHRLRQGGVGLFYFAGHGVQVQGENYLIPLRAHINREQDVPYEAVPVGRILGGMEDAGNSLNILILDACRDNPFARKWRSTQRGLIGIQAVRGSLIAYATAPGAVALDGSGRNGLYTAALLQHLTTPELSVEQLFKRVRAEVVAATGGQQIPWESSSLLGDFAFASPAPGAPTVSASPGPPLPLPPPLAPSSAPARMTAPETRPANPGGPGEGKEPPGAVEASAVEPSRADHPRRRHSVRCSDSDPAAFRLIKELGRLEADDDLNQATYNFVICEERDTAKDALQVSISSGVLTGTYWTREQAQEMAATMARKGVRCEARGAPYGPVGKHDHRRITYRLCQSKGKPVAVEIHVITLQADATPYPAKQLVVDWPQ